jgi:predicted ATPase
MTTINFENLGNISKGSVGLNNFTIFTGENNTGKTYATYGIYSLLDKDFSYKLKEINPIVEELYKDGLYILNLKEFFDTNYSNIKKEIENSFSKSLSNVFSANETEFKKSKVSFESNYSIAEKKFFLSSEHKSTLSIGKQKNIVFEISKDKNSLFLKLTLLEKDVPKDIISNNLKDALSRLVFNKLFSNSFLLPAERTGLNLFYKELNSERTAMFHHMSKTQIDKTELIKDLIISRYPQPIADYIDFLNKIDILKKQNSKFKDLSIIIQKDILKGKYKVEKDGIYFLPYKKNSNKENYNEKISLHLTSSTVKTFFSLVFYLEHLAKKGETLIIDEPELNLHPDNQRKIARILTMLVNRGVKVIVSTHSDYFVREVNNLIMLKDDFQSKQDIINKYSYDENMLISADKVSAYVFCDNGINKMEIDSKEGIIAKTFDNVIDDLNTLSDEIFYTKQEEIENEESSN